MRTPGDIFEQWEREHGVDAQRLSERVWSRQDQVEEELCVEEVPPSARGRSNELAMLGARKEAFDSHWMKRYVKGCEGSGQCLQGCRKLRKQSTNLNYVPEVLEKGGHIVTCAPVRKVRLEGRRAVGVTGRFVHPRTRAKGAVFEAVSYTHLTLPTICSV